MSSTLYNFDRDFYTCENPLTPTCRKVRLKQGDDLRHDLPPLGTSGFFVTPRELKVERYI
jgi:hypothetical protein